MSLINPYEPPNSVFCQTSSTGSQIIAEFRPHVGFRIFWTLIGIVFLAGAYPLCSLVLNRTPIIPAGVWFGGGGIMFFMITSGAASFLNVFARIRVFENGIEARYGLSAFVLWENISDVSFKYSFKVTFNNGKKRAWEIGLGDTDRLELLQLSKSLMNKTKF